MLKSPGDNSANDIYIALGRLRLKLSRVRSSASSSIHDLACIPSTPEHHRLTVVAKTRISRNEMSPRYFLYYNEAKKWSLSKELRESLAICLSNFTSI